MSDPVEETRPIAGRGKRLQVLDMSGACLKGARLRRANLAGAILHFANLRASDLRG
ncbi:MAG: pentapeptide repeat-containing protein, partial [Chloroflexi bacterium]|nr:pentapeptide repeat-containing protein [Chloroflexota bacterium]